MKKIIAIAAAVLILALSVFPGSAYKSYKAAAAANGNVKDGEVIYYENFNIDDLTGNDAVMAKLGWKVLNKEDGALTDNTVNYSIKDGKLYIDNVAGTDSYCRVLTDEQMWEVVSSGKYTLQYDVCITEDASTSAKDRYIVMVLNYDGDTYNSCHIRTNGRGNNQTRIDGSWSTYDIVGENYASGDDVSSDSVVSKLTNGATKYEAGKAALLNLNFTIRYQCDRDAYGPTIYMRNNDIPNSEFVLVSKSSDTGSASVNWYNEAIFNHFGIALKPSQKVCGFIDNVVVYTGLGNTPENLISTYVPSDLSAVKIKNAYEENGGVCYSGCQSKTDGITTTVRFVGAVSTKKYENVGFKITMNAGNGDVDKSVTMREVLTKIYGKVNGESEAYYAWSDGASYLFCTEIADVPNSGTVTFTVTPFNTKFDGTVNEADTYIITYTDGVLVSQQYK